LIIGVLLYVWDCIYFPSLVTTKKNTSMTNRRQFLKTATIASFAVVLPSFAATSEETPIPTPSKVRKPIVLSTWNFGLQANAAAWEVLKNNGKSLDAVEAGVKIPEGDPNERSVGYGGRPDRDGRVTLDACIMDEKANIGAVGCLEHIKHPISVARAVIEKTPHVMLVGEGALQFALSQGFTKKIYWSKPAKKSGKNGSKPANTNPLPISKTTIPLE
jgi:N4-(beta-N-acetylglucosaminyl)-L-asparaginase